MNRVTKTKRSQDTIYYFDKLDQSKNYIRVDSLFLSSDRKAVNRARKILNDPKAVILIEEEK